MKDKRMILSFVWLVLGVVLFGLGAAEVVDAYWSGMGGGFIAVAILQLVRFYRFHHNAEYRENVEIQVQDERNRFIRSKAWAWAGYLFILLSAVASIALRVLGQEVWAMAASYGLCMMLVLYWVSYLVLRKKY